MTKIIERMVTIELLPRPKQKLPSARLRFSVDIPATGGHRIQAAYLSLTSRGTAATTSRSFCGGDVVIDFNAKGVVIGAEFLAEPRELDVSRLQAFARKSKQPIIADMLHATAQFWTALDVGAGLWGALIKRRNLRDKPPAPVKGEWKLAQTG
jgi:uncharacterized protein YuzE